MIQTDFSDGESGGGLGGSTSASIPSCQRKSFKVFAKSELSLCGKFTIRECHKADELTFYYAHFSLLSICLCCVWLKSSWKIIKTNCTCKVHNKSKVEIYGVKVLTIQPWVQIRICIILRKHAYSNVLKILQPKKEIFQIKKFWYFSNFCSKHKLCVLVRTASTRRF